MAEADVVFGTLPLQMLAGLRRLLLLSVHEPQRVQHKLTNTVGRSGTGRGSIYGGGLARGRLRLGCGLAPRSKGFGCWLIGCANAASPPSVQCPACHSPEVHGKLPGHGDDGLLATRYL